MRSVVYQKELKVINDLIHFISAGRSDMHDANRFHTAKDPKKGPPNGEPLHTFVSLTLLHQQRLFRTVKFLALI